MNNSLNLALDSPIGDGPMHCNAPPNPHNNPIFNVHDNAYNQNYRPGSSMTDLSTDSGSFLSNSSLQHFSPPEAALQNYLPRRKYEAYKEVVHEEQMYPQRQHFKMPQEQWYPSLADYGVSMNAEDEQRMINNNVMKAMSPKVKAKEKQTFSPMGFPKNMSQCGYQQVG